MMLAACMLVALLAVPTLEQPQGSRPTSLCPNVRISEPPDSEPGRWFGIVNLPPHSTQHSQMTLNIVLDRKAEKLGNRAGNLSIVSSEDNMDFKMKIPNTQINKSRAGSVDFFVEYDSKNQKPRLLSVKLNGKDICTNQTIVTSKIQEDRSNSSNVGFLTTMPTPAHTTEDTYIPEYSDYAEIGLKRIIGLYNKVSAKNNVDQKQCGILKEEGQWPWQVTLYKTAISLLLAIDREYICGGTLVSHRHIITAAQCVIRKDSKKLVSKNSLTVYLGKDNQQQIATVDNIIIHEGYNTTSFEHDVAILVLREPVTYSETVRAVCLWPKSEKYELVNAAGKNGWLMDSDMNGNGSVIPLNPVEMSVVSQDFCTDSYREQMETLISNFTYCAANVGDSSFCPCSSGGGMVFKLGNTWHLRGLVSMFSREPDQAKCEHYLVFSDLAKYLAWIRLNLYDY